MAVPILALFRVELCRPVAPSGRWRLDAPSATCGKLIDVHDSDELYEQVRSIVAAIPPGQVTTYGDIAACLSGVGPRSVGRVMRNDSQDLPWWRVVNASGRPAPGAEARARREYDREGTPLVIRAERPYRVDLRAARWSPDTGLLDDM